MGVCHTPSLEVMKSRKPLVTTEAEASKMSGVKPGFTLPIILAEEVVGSIAIAGDPGEVKKFGLLVQKQAEIMLREQALMQQNMLREKALRDLAESIASYDPTRGNETMILLQGEELGYDLKLCRIALIVELKSCVGEQVGSTMRRVLDCLKNTFHHPKNVFCPLNSFSASAFLVNDYKLDDEKLETYIYDLCCSCVNLLNKEGIDISIGVGRSAKKVGDLAESYRKAREALSLGQKIRSNDERCFSASNFIMECALASIPLNKQRDFVAQTLGKLADRPDSSELIETFRAWCKHSFKTNEAAKSLSLHRNSLLYRLKKLESITGLSPWNFKDCMKLAIAIFLKSLGLYIL
jgi:carbohydrate diacid regulator